MMGFPLIAGIPPLFGKVLVAAVTFGSGALQNLLDKFLPVWYIIRFDNFGGFYIALEPDNFISIDYTASQNISNYPIEQGQFATYNKINNPNQVILKVSVGGSESKKNDFLNDVEKMARSFDYFEVVAPSGSYKNLTVESYEYRREVSSGVGVLAVTIHFVEIMSAKITEQAVTPKDASATSQVAG
jgi:hypothetical protein